MGHKEKFDKIKKSASDIFREGKGLSSDIAAEVINTIADSFADSMDNFQKSISERKKFFEELKRKKERGRDYKIITVKNNNTGEVRHVGYGIPLSIYLMNRWVIHSFIRLKDGKVFKQSDPVIYQNGPDTMSEKTQIIFKIDFTFWNDDRLIVQLSNLQSYGIDQIELPPDENKEADTATSPVSEQKMFKTVTEDGVEFKEGDINPFADDGLWPVVQMGDDFRILHLKAIGLHTNYSYPYPYPFLYFSTEKIAKSWVVLNKPCLSLHDFRIWYMDKYNVKSFPTELMTYRLLEEKVTKMLFPEDPIKKENE